LALPPIATTVKCIMTSKFLRCQYCYIHWQIARKEIHDQAALCERPVLRLYATCI